ncbi:MAG TPA: undecaprenyldiphospho-muramoylpentapeptide beta-N-acetylglucosaminyltransferase [Vicinamibacterales bacterium]|nr:undecaprenyldiphospho-muramoylpentapeptide beta-N-acetylglucosaminyltransferase [Vicinamibacterales bacterium]
MRVVIAGGGTGGHLFPGLAVARALKARVPDATISFAGTASGIEARVIPSTEFELDVIRSGGLKGKSPAALLRGLALLPLSALDAWSVISRRRPEVVIGVGGYSSGPVVGIAAVRGIPTLLLEQNAVPGITNRLLAPLVKAAAVTYDSSTSFFGGKAFVSGNPVRQEFLHVDDAAVHADHVRVLIFGGSQGAHAINVAVAEAAERLAGSGDAPAVTVVCQTGTRDFDMVREAFQRAGVQGRVERFIDAMDREVNDAGVIVSRAGATTLAEIMAAGRPSILIPLPTATDDHQRKNAEALGAAGAAEVIEQKSLTGALLVDRIRALAGDKPRRLAMSKAARGLARPDAADRIVDVALRLSGRRAS